MNSKITNTLFNFWFMSSFFVAISAATFMNFLGKSFELYVYFILFFISLIGSIPGIIAIWICIYFIKKSSQSSITKLLKFFIPLFSLSFIYGVLIGGIFYSAGIPGAMGLLEITSITIVILFLATIIPCIILIRQILDCLHIQGFDNSTLTQIFVCIFSSTNKYKTMEIQEQPIADGKPSNSYLLKGFITGILILLMLIPTIFINNLVTERQERQQQVVREVSNKWAMAQTLSGPFLVVPYNYSMTNKEGKTVPAKKNIILLPEDLHVTGTIQPEERKRSIYTVLLYKTDLIFKGNFNIHIPDNIIQANLDFKNSRLCFSLSDFKGIEEEMAVQFNHEKIHFSPGLPVGDLGETGLSAMVEFDSSHLNMPVQFQLSMKLKGSSQLHFMPLSANSIFQLSSTWPNPSFDGNVIPGKHNISETGFSAQWDFSQANLPFGTVIAENELKQFRIAQNYPAQNTMQEDTAPNNFLQNDLSFGVSLVQPADQYGQTLRSVKYAILFIGLSFAFFFIIEIMQKKPFHPVQYVLVGLALVIFYTLLLSFSEYILFDYAYLIAALATVLLISIYVKSHFKNWKTAGIFFCMLSGLYGFIFILIRLEDTALIVGSIGLFVILAVVMFASRKINWYGNTISPG